MVTVMVATTVIVAALALWLAARYWRGRIRHNDEIHNFKLIQKNFEFNSELQLERDRQEAIELLQKKERLESDKKTKKALSKVDLVYDILHDVQAVHQGIYGFLKLIMDPALTLPEKEMEFLRLETKKKSRLLRDMVDCAIETLQYENIVDVPVNDDVLVNSFCQDMFDACQRYLKNDDVELTFETSLPDDFVVHTNLGYLRKLFKNLLICSMEYTQKGFIKLKVALDSKRQLLSFVLSDTGLGIPDDVLEHVFEKLPREGFNNKVTGVRLRICYALVHLLGGSIYVDRQYSPGTSIVFTIKTNK